MQHRLRLVLLMVGYRDPSAFRRSALRGKPVRQGLLQRPVAQQPGCLLEAQSLLCRIRRHIQVYRMKGHRQGRRHFPAEPKVPLRLLAPDAMLYMKGMKGEGKLRFQTLQEPQKADGIRTAGESQKHAATGRDQSFFYYIILYTISYRHSFCLSGESL